MTATASQGRPATHATIGILRRKRLTAIGISAAILAYFVYIFFAFNIPEVIRSIDGDDARILVSDSYSYKTHVSRDNRTGEVAVAIEGERKGRYPEGESPSWVEMGETTVINLSDDHIILFSPEEIRYDIPGYGLVTARPGSDGVNATFPEGDLPAWINASRNRVAITTEAGRLSITRNRSEALRYFAGWELFFFTLDSPYSGLSFGDVMARAFSGEAGKIWEDFWHNDMWRHADVVWAIGETILMAFIGTFGAAMLAFPMAFLAAKNFAPLGPVRFVFRRVFDFVRGVDGLIWTIILSRAFGPGPMTGALAILVTDTGSFGKTFSEALENVDKKQIDGVTSTGAKPLQRYRFGVIPQVVPVLLSQILYFLESNTRSATIIGAITGGGIGLLLTQAIITQKDWEEVTYYIILIIIMVMLMDAFSGWLRGRLIGRKN